MLLSISFFGKKCQTSLRLPSKYSKLEVSLSTDGLSFMALAHAIPLFKNSFALLPPLFLLLSLSCSKNDLNIINRGMKIGNRSQYDSKIFIFCLTVVVISSAFVNVTQGILL